MSYQSFLIANYRSGFEHSVAPWLLPQDAFQEVEDAYFYHGSIRKRDGYTLFGTLNGNQVTGIYTFITNTGEREVLATDTGRLFRYDPVGQVFDILDAADVFNSTNYMWFCNYGVTGSISENTLYLTNFADNMRSYVTGAATTTAFIPQYGASAVNDLVATSLMAFTFKSRLVLLRTKEGSTSPGSATDKPQRVRWSQAGNPNIWRDDIPGQGGFADAPTGDFIIGARFLRDYIIVFFSNSTWSLRPTSDPALPFRWDKINSFRACDATFATLPYDRYIISFGRTGIVACDGVEVQRIDQKIEDFVTDDVDAESFPLMYSDRSYSERRSWTLYTEDDDNGQHTKALIRSDDDGSWSKYNIGMSCLGQGEAFIDYEFDDFVDQTFIDYSDETFDSFYFQEGSNLFLGGDYEGNVYILENGTSDNGEEIPFSIKGANWNPFKERGIEAQLGYVDIYADVDPYTDLTVKFYLNDDFNPYTEQTINLIPEEGYLADIQDISLTNPAQILSMGHGLVTGNSIYIAGVLGTEEINGGPYQVTVIDENNFTLDGIDATGFTAYTSGGIVTEYNPYEFAKVWKRAYAGGIGYNHTVQIETTGLNQSLVIDSITPWFRPAGTRMIG